MKMVSFFLLRSWSYQMQHQHDLHLIAAKDSKVSYSLKIWGDNQLGVSSKSGAQAASTCITEVKAGGQGVP